MIGLLCHNLVISQFGVLGAFSYLAFQKVSIAYNLKATLYHGLSLIAAFILGVFVSKAIFLLPFVIAMLYIIGFLATKIYRIPKPGHFFVIMVFATATNLNLPLYDLPKMSGYISIGVISGMINAVLLSYIEKLPWQGEQDAFQRLSFKDKYYVTIYNRPRVWIDAINFAFILFVAGYIAYLLRQDFGYWVLISSAAVLSGEEVAIIKHRYLGRILGSIIGLLIGAVLISLPLSTLTIMNILLFLNISVEYFMPRNYALANFFTNPLVLLLSLLTTKRDHTDLILGRLNGVIIGSLLVGLLIGLMHYALKTNDNEF
ncbi:MAG: FUSC family protein [Lactococcus sp.]|nr:FUSC family protein [Lactococcus sp.]MDN5409798.1 FUSC family protein [Lactococcus sp.]MDN5412397.1 FUSC family protein [Lactococcus sp.]MDN5436768.1 FUSC family protein [Lactococcus sp.]MDN5462145.1 FUSC family protein [Lactococcus sp.]MDN5466621.1 FUSC family protein [Lactococcus sp.]